MRILDFPGIEFAGDYRFIPYSKHLRPAQLLSMVFPILRHKLYGRAIAGIGMVAVGQLVHQAHKNSLMGLI